jgi:hypothetical protein
MKKLLLSFLMVSCKEATFFVIKNEEGKLSLLNRLKLDLHTSMCAICKSFEDQSAIIASESRHILTDVQLGPVARNRIEKILNNQSS